MCSEAVAAVKVLHKYSREICWHYTCYLILPFAPSLGLRWLQNHNNFYFENLLTFRGCLTLLPTFLNEKELLQRAVQHLLLVNNAFSIPSKDLWRYVSLFRHSYLFSCFFDNALLPGSEIPRTVFKQPALYNCPQLGNLTFLGRLIPLHYATSSLTGDSVSCLSCLVYFEYKQRTCWRLLSYSTSCYRK